MEQNRYEKKSVHTLILSFSLPAIVSLIVEIMASVVDTAFAGHLGDVSVDALTAMGLLAPVLNIYTAFQALFAVSTSIMLAKYLREKEIRNEYFLTGLCMTFIESVGVSVLSYLGLPKLLSVLGAETQIAVLAEEYLKIQLFSNVFSALGYTLTSCIRAFGYPTVELLLTGFAVAVNIMFNAIFVFGLGMGFAGLAYGTLVSEIFCCAFAALWLMKKQLFVSITPISWKKTQKYVFELLKLGIAQTIIQSLGGCTALFVNQSLIQHTTRNYVAVWNIVQKIYTVFLMPIVGITQGVQTILAYFNGQQEETKKKKTLTITMMYTVLYGVAGTVLIFFFGKNILAWFASSEIIYSIGNTILCIVFSTFPLMGIFYTIMTLYEVTGHEGKAVFLILTRQVFLMLPLIYLLPRIFSGFSLAIFWAVPIADLIALLTAVFSRGRKKSSHRHT